MPTLIVSFSLTSLKVFIYHNLEFIKLYINIGILYCIIKGELISYK